MLVGEIVFVYINFTVRQSRASYCTEIYSQILMDRWLNISLFLGFLVRRPLLGSCISRLRLSENRGRLTGTLLTRVAICYPSDFAIPTCQVGQRQKDNRDANLWRCMHVQFLSHRFLPADYRLVEIETASLWRLKNRESDTRRKMLNPLRFQLLVENNVKRFRLN